MSIVPWRLFTRWHRFYWTGVQAGLTIGRYLKLPLYQVRDLMIAVDVLLSSGSIVSWFALAGAAATFLVTANPAPLIAALVLVLLFRALRYRERRLWRQHWLKRLDIYDVDIGSARTLKGRIAVGHLFLESGAGRYWSKAKVEEAMSRAGRAGRWIVTQASSYGVQLEMSHERIHVLESLAGWEERVRDVEYCIGPEAQFFAEASRGTDGACLVVHVPFQGTSFACPAFLADPGTLPVEWCLVEVDASEAIIAHEILHLFGGDDHYHCAAAVERKAKQELIGRSIMFDANRSIEELVVDGVTAQNVGWL